ncbi:MAG: methionine sulfoxide reductase catalytic subunit [Verrucomicrobiota bacterium]|jgi:sulfoxide reductase catalytic subunit YedY
MGRPLVFRTGCAIFIGMASLIIAPRWRLPDRDVTPFRHWLNRRQFLQQLGGAGIGAMTLGTGGSLIAAEPLKPSGFPARRNPLFNPGWRLTNEHAAGTYNNFYEFSLDKEEVRKLASRLITSPWPVEIGGMVEKPMSVDAGELAAQFPLEERVYRFRCVEAWAMVVPWTGFPLSKLIEKARPTSAARFVRFETFNRPESAPGMKQMPTHPWPYTEGLRMDEALHPLTFIATGIYGKPLPQQHGAPLRLVVPWKYGYKSIKSIVKIEFVGEQPSTFWESLAASEYPFESNVNPRIPHPRWSQAFERLIDTGDRVRTQPFNGYGNDVAKLYARV